MGNLIKVLALLQRDPTSLWFDVPLLYMLLLLVVKDHDPIDLASHPSAQMNHLNEEPANIDMVDV